MRLDQAAKQITLNENTLGLDRFYRFGPGNRPFTDPSYQQFQQSFEGIGLRPYSPVHLRAVEHANGNIDLNWIRRTRLGGDRWDRPEVPLAEENESYIVRVLQGQDLRREEVVGTPQWSYSAEARWMDGLTGFYRIEVAQISAEFGPGAPAAITLAA